MSHKFPYKWVLKDGYPAKGIQYHGSTVFSCFSCGGGSTMGYKLAGYDVIGCNEIDPKMMEAYKTNHNPQFSYLEPIQTFKTRQNLPPELFNLDILDGSPPCSSFSISGNRDKDWGKKKKFREGQRKQVLDTLFFDFIDLAKRLQPKAVIAENVKGILLGNAKKYCAAIYDAFNKAGYYLDKWPLNASKMGVPQRRERVFFIGIRKDLANQLPQGMDLFNGLPSLDLGFNEHIIRFSEIFNNYSDRPLSDHYKKFWDIKRLGDVDFSASSARMDKNPNAQFQYKYIYMDKVSNTITVGEQCVLFDHPRHRNFDELCDGGSYPKDYNFINNKAHYLIGMSVPPVMMAQIASRVYEQWLNKLK